MVCSISEFRFFKAPPKINDRGTSGDMTVREGNTIHLRCRAEGHPTPTIEWKREDGKPIWGLDEDGKRRWEAEDLNHESGT